jgi:hypothetical protein
VYVHRPFSQMCYMSFMLSIVIVWNYIFYNDGQFKMYNVLGFYFAIFMFWNPALRCRLTNRRWSKLQSQRSAGALAGNQLLPNASLERDGKALIDLVDGLSLGSVVLVCVTDGDLADHDARLGGGAAKRLPSHGDQAQAIAATLFVVVWVLLGSSGLCGNGLGSD